MQSRTRLPVVSTGNPVGSSGVLTSFPRASDPTWASMPYAQGPGMFGSELDAAFLDIENLLPGAKRAQFARETDVDTRDNPDDEEDDPNAPKMPMQNLYPLAILVTGRWGHRGALKVNARDLPSTFDVPGEYAPAGAAAVTVQRERFEPKKGVPVVTRLPNLPFFARMKALEEAFDAAIEKVTTMYAGGVGKWISALEKCRLAVQAVRAQHALPAAQRSVFGHDPRKPKSDPKSIVTFGHMAILEGRPAFRSVVWGMLKDDGNSKLPFSAYSELPMSTCPGAGDCGVYMKDAETGGPIGYCYSFKAWRYPDSFARQFLTTLANTADREFRIAEELRPGPFEEVPDDGSDTAYWTRVRAALRRARRPWTEYVAAEVLRAAVKTVRADVRAGRVIPAGGRVTMFRLFVDGDIGAEDGIASWMLACRSLADPRERAALEVKRKFPRGSLGVVQVYGYSKCWGEFVNLHKMVGCQVWPDNYVVNMSDASVYAKSPAVRDEMMKFPITRGYFRVIELSKYLDDLVTIDPTKLQMPERAPLPHVTEKQLAGLVEIGRATNIEDVARILHARFGIEAFVQRTYEPSKFVLYAHREKSNEYVEVPIDGASLAAGSGGGTGDRPLFVRYRKPAKEGAAPTYDYEPWSPTEGGRSITASLPRADETKADLEARVKAEQLRLRQDGFDAAVMKILEDPRVRDALKLDIARDKGFFNVNAFMKDFRAKERTRREAFEAKEKERRRIERKGFEAKEFKPKEPDISKEEQLKKKALTLLTHTLFLAAQYDKAGSCPLVCGNCADVVVPKELYARQKTFEDIPALTGAVHRCASKRPADPSMPPPKSCAPSAPDDRPGYYGADIHIGLH